MNGHVHSAVFLLYSTWNPAQPHAAAWMGGEFGGRVDTSIPLAQALRVHLKLSQHCELGKFQHKVKSLKKLQHINVMASSEWRILSFLYINFLSKAIITF